MRQTNKINLYPYLLLLPALLALGIILLYPMLNGFILSFQNQILTKPVTSGSRFIGFQNYIAMFKDPVFYTSLVKTFWWVFFSVGLELLLGLLVALLLNEQFPLRSLVRGLILVPWVTPAVVSALVWAWMFDGTYGIINDILKKIHFISVNIPWLGDSRTALPAVIATNVWKGFPFFAISILAALQTIPKELYEAAEIDGAGILARFRSVTIPSIRPVLITTTVLRIIWTTNTTDLIFTMTKGGPGYSTHVLALYTYLTAWGKLDFGYSSALAIFLMIVLFILIGIYMKLMNKEGEETGI